MRWSLDEKATRKQILHLLVASCVQSRHFVASTLREQLFELKNEDAIKKSENLPDTCAFIWEKKWGRH